MMIEKGEEMELRALNSEKIDIEDFVEKDEKSFGEKSKKFLKRRVFILSWLPDYNSVKAIGDLIAGVTIGLTMVPQSLAYANLANLPPQYGLYSAFMGSLVYTIFGTVKEVSIGPTSLMSILTVSYTYEKPVEYVIIMTFVCGCVEFLLGVFKLGFIVNFISAPVVSAFSTSTSLIIIGAQLKNLLGLKFSAKNFPITLVKLAKHLAESKPWDAGVGLFAIIFLILLKEHFPQCLIVVITSYFAYQISLHQEKVPFRLSEKVDPGVPSFQLPAFSVTRNNETIGFMDICSDIGSGLILLPMVSILANVAIAKSFTSGKVVDASQEMMALGLANFFGSFFRSIPTCGAFTRSAVSNASGMQSPFSGVYSAAMTLLALTLLTPYFEFIPRTTLAAILICAVYSLIGFKIAKLLWKFSKIDFFSWLGCLVVCIGVGVEHGLLFGVAVSLISILYKAARPETSVHVVKDQRVITVKPSAGFDFPGADFMREKVTRAVITTNYKFPIELDCSKISSLDFTTVKGFESLEKDLKLHNQTLTFVNIDEQLEKKLKLKKETDKC